MRLHETTSECLGYVRWVMFKMRNNNQAQIHVYALSNDPLDEGFEGQHQLYMCYKKCYKISCHQLGHFVWHNPVNTKLREIMDSRELLMKIPEAFALQRLISTRKCRRSFFGISFVRECIVSCSGVNMAWGVASTVSTVIYAVPSRLQYGIGTCNKTVPCFRVHSNIAYAVFDKNQEGIGKLIFIFFFLQMIWLQTAEGECSCPKGRFSWCTLYCTW